MRSSIEAERTTRRRPPVPACTKICYSSRTRAGTALHAIQQSTRAGRKTPQGIYPCQWCRFWHLTSNPRSSSNRWTVSLTAPHAR